MRKTAPLLLLTLFSLVSLFSLESAFGQTLTVRVDSAFSQSTVSRSRSTVLRVGGVSVGEPVVEQLDPVVEPDKPAKVLALEYEGNLENCFVKVRSSTCRPKQLTRGTYLIDEPGKHVVRVDLLDKDTGNWPDLEILVEVGDVQPEPPDVQPEPPDVEPDQPEDQPIPDGLRVLVVYEATELTKMPVSQREILMSRDVRDYLAGVCASRNNVPEYRFLDKDAEFTGSGQETFVGLMSQRPADSPLPYLLISGALDVVYSGPLPDNTTDFRKLLDRWVPNKADTGPNKADIRQNKADIGPRYELRRFRVQKCDGLRCWFEEEERLVLVN